MIHTILKIEFFKFHIADDCRYTMSLLSLRRMSGRAPLLNTIILLIQPKCVACKEEEQLQKKDVHNFSKTGSSSSLESRMNSFRGSGNPLPDDTRIQMESSFGADFGNVRIHMDSLAEQMSKDLNAQAFAYGRDIFFNSGRYNPESTEGKRLLAHELTHVIKQIQWLTLSVGMILNPQQERPRSLNTNMQKRKIRDMHNRIHWAGKVNLQPSQVENIKHGWIYGRPANRSKYQLRKIAEKIPAKGFQKKT